MNRQIRTILEWLHVTLLLAPISNLLYHMVYMEEKTFDGYGLYVSGWSILLVVMLSAILANRCKSLVSYGLAGVVAVALMSIFQWLAGPELQKNPALYGNVAIMGFETFAIWVKRFSDRLRTATDRQDEEGEPYWNPSASFLNRISLSGFWLLVFYYVFGICFTSRVICNIAFFSAVIYGIFLIIYAFSSELTNYIFINKRVQDIPIKRIYGISTAMLGVLLLLLVISLLPSVLLISHRQYTDIRTWFTGVERTQQEWETQPPVHTGPVGNGSMMEMFLQENEEPKEMPILVKLVLWGMAGAFMLMLLFMVWKEIRKVFSDFRKTYDENGDKIEVIEDFSKEEIVGRRTEKRDQRTEKIRRQYKKTIRKHRKEAPQEYETPTEMEEKAGLLEDEGMQQLHLSYENARYAKTKDDVS